MKALVRIAVDAMGGDNAPAAIVEGVVNAVNHNRDLEVTLVGPEDVVRPLLPAGVERITVLHATEVIEGEDDPLVAIRKKRKATMLVALDLLKEGKVDAAVSAGNTGAFMSGALFYTGRIKGIQRPALAPLLPTLTGVAMLIDCGANADCKPEFLLQFAQMGSVYMEQVMGVKNPRIGLLNNGAEEDKGSAMHKAAHQLLKGSALNFRGNVEGRDALDGNVDVIVSDGFTGNVFLKSAEGISMFLFTLMKEQFGKSLKRKIGAALLYSGLRAVKHKLDYTEYGGSLLLGIDGVVVKAHGSSNAKAFESALRQAMDAVKKDVVGTIRQSLVDTLEKES